MSNVSRMSRYIIMLSWLIVVVLMGRVLRVWLTRPGLLVGRCCYLLHLLIGDAEGVRNNRVQVEGRSRSKRNFKGSGFPSFFFRPLLHSGVNPCCNYCLRGVDVACLNNEVVTTWARFFFVAFGRNCGYVGFYAVILRIFAGFLSVRGFFSGFVAAFHSSTARRKRSFRIMQPGINLTLSTEKAEVKLSSM